ncbi:MAG TPA: hypothetical protein PK431_02420 [Chitinophagales bacterium]|nr:hypothetical protein [Chitinophagales bacterium]
MKIGVIIFSFYLLALSTMPCADVSQVQIAKAHSVTASAKHQHNNDFCTPFCICACCGQPVTSKINYPVAQTILKPDIFNKNIAINDQTFNSQFSASIWQPPKIS